MHALYYLKTGLTWVLKACSEHIASILDRDASVSIERLCTFQQGLKAPAERVNARSGCTLPARRRQNAGLCPVTCRCQSPRHPGISLLRRALHCRAGAALYIYPAGTVRVLLRGIPHQKGVLKDVQSAICPLTLCQSHNSGAWLHAQE